MLSYCSLMIIVDNAFLAFLLKLYVLYVIESSKRSFGLGNSLKIYLSVSVFMCQSPRYLVWWRHSTAQRVAYIYSLLFQGPRNTLLILIGDLFCNNPFCICYFNSRANLCRSLAVGQCRLASMDSLLRNIHSTTHS